jgi:hypothetical protein
VADEAGLPMLFDEAAQQILWPGTPQYEEWAAEVPEEAEQDRQVCVLGASWCSRVAAEGGVSTDR